MEQDILVAFMHSAAAPLSHLKLYKLEEFGGGMVFWLCAFFKGSLMVALVTALGLQGT